MLVFSLMREGREREREEGKKRKRTSRRMNLGAGKVGKYSKLGFKSLTGTGGAKFGRARGSSALMAQSVNGVLYESLCLLCIHDSDVRSFVRDCTPRLDDLLVHKLSTELSSSSSFFLSLRIFFFLFRALVSDRSRSSDLGYEEDEENRLRGEKDFGAMTKMNVPVTKRRNLRYRKGKGRRG